MAMRVVARLIKLYLAYGLVDVIVKILRSALKAQRTRSMLKDVPRVRFAKTGVMGGLNELLENLHRRHDLFNELTAGNPVSLAIAGPTFDPMAYELIVRDPAVIKHFLKNSFEKYTKGDDDMFWQTLKLWLGKGIFVASHGVGSHDQGQNWARQRKIAASIFNRGNFNENMNDVFVAKGAHLCGLLRASAAQGDRVDMQAKFFQYTMDSIMQIFFGEPADTMGGQANKYAAGYDTAHRCIVEYFFTSLGPLSLSKLLPWPFGGTNGLAHKLHRMRHPLYQEFKEAYAVLDSESRRLVANCRNDPKLQQRKDLLALFVQQEDASERMSTEWLRDVVLNMVIAGRDTTACTLSWMFYILATHPEIQAKVCKEIDEHLPADEDMNFKNVGDKELPYLHGVLYEALRLYPPVPQNHKKAVADDVLPDGTKIFKNTKMVYLPYVMARDPERYPEPLVVKPERWIPFKEPLPHEFPVFQAGPRICLGMNMAIFEAKIVAGMLLRNYTFDISPEEAKKITYLPTALTMSICNSKTHDSHNLWLTPKRRPSSK